MSFSSDFINQQQIDHKNKNNIRTSMKFSFGGTILENNQQEQNQQQHEQAQYDNKTETQSKPNNSVQSLKLTQTPSPNKNISSSEVMLITANTTSEKQEEKKNPFEFINRMFQPSAKKVKTATSQRLTQSQNNSQATKGNKSQDQTFIIQSHPAKGRTEKALEAHALIKYILDRNKKNIVIHKINMIDRNTQLHSNKYNETDGNGQNTALRRYLKSLQRKKEVKTENSEDQESILSKASQPLSSQSIISKTKSSKKRRKQIYDSLSKTTSKFPKNDCCWSGRKSLLLDHQHSEAEEEGKFKINNSQIKLRSSFKHGDKLNDIYKKIKEEVRSIKQLNSKSNFSKKKKQEEMLLKAAQLQRNQKKQAYLEGEDQIQGPSRKDTNTKRKFSQISSNDHHDLQNPNRRVISVSGLASHTFRSVKAARNIGYRVEASTPLSVGSKGNNNFSKKPRSLQQQRKKSIQSRSAPDKQRKIKQILFQDQCVSQSKKDLPLDQYLQDIQNHKTNISMIYGEQNGRLNFINEIMKKQGLQRDLGEFAVDQIKRKVEQQFQQKSAYTAANMAKTTRNLYKPISNSHSLTKKKLGLQTRRNMLISQDQRQLNNRRMIAKRQTKPNPKIMLSKRKVPDSNLKNINPSTVLINQFTFISDFQRQQQQQQSQRYEQMKELQQQKQNVRAK